LPTSAGLPRISPLGRVVGAIADVASALGYDVEAAVLEPDDQ